MQIIAAIGILALMGYFANIYGPDGVVLAIGLVIFAPMAFAGVGMIMGGYSEHKKAQDRAKYPGMSPSSGFFMIFSGVALLIVATIAGKWIIDNIVR